MLFKGLRSKNLDKKAEEIRSVPLVSINSSGRGNVYMRNENGLLKGYREETPQENKISSKIRELDRIINNAMNEKVTLEAELREIHEKNNSEWSEMWEKGE